MPIMVVAALILSFVAAVQAHRGCSGSESPLSRIDTHSHFVPPFWREASVKYGYGNPDGMPGIPVSKPSNPPDKGSSN